MRDGNLAEVFADHPDALGGIGDFQSARLAQMRAVADIDRVAVLARLGRPLGV